MAKLIVQPAYTYDDVLIKPQYSEVVSRKDVDISVEIAPGVKLDIPIMPVNMQTVISVDLCVKISELGGMATLHQFASIDEQVKMLQDVKSRGARVAGAIGATKDYLERAKALIDNGVSLIIMDTPHAHSFFTINAVKEFRKMFGDFPFIAGNIATREAAVDLINAGVDGIKVGVGPGAACLTRVNAGAGMPQLTAVLECAEIAKQMGKTVIADGGIQTPGNFAKAIGAGGTVAFIGSMFAGTDESPSELVVVNGKKFKRYFGSSSESAKELRIQDDPAYKNKPNEFIEGADGLTKYHGSVESLVEKLTMGLRSAMSYSGAFTVNEYQEKVIFFTVTQSGFKENGAHGLITS
jgi:IMP dehydrogenase